MYSSFIDDNNLVYVYAYASYEMVYKGIHLNCSLMSCCYGWLVMEFDIQASHHLQSLHLVSH